MTGATGAKGDDQTVAVYPHELSSSPVQSTMNTKYSFNVDCPLNRLFYNTYGDTNVSLTVGSSSNDAGDGPPYYQPNFDPT